MLNHYKMEQDISKSYIPPPLMLCDCYLDGKTDLVRYRLYCRRIYKNNFIDIESMIKNKNNKKKKLNDTTKSSKKQRTPRSVKCHHTQV